ncbi:hypothetical protein PC110_g14743 [Phytophthora cactorum]|uniref:Uncharacterized protein n=1 Tax=Phytophthora cactorum TaxID=29920 RepID=A0A329RZ68_9STRA|nr:hypothetical protein C6341_g16880 [Phytophthora cactorum]RAW28886.1 hypothetical protein PC110_g14743 [Phytophthora cactorum]
MPRYAQVARMTVGDNQAVLRVAKAAVDLSAPPAVEHQLQTAVEPAVQSPTEHFAPEVPRKTPIQTAWQQIVRQRMCQASRYLLMSLQQRFRIFPGLWQPSQHWCMVSKLQRPAKRRRQRRAAKAAGKWKTAFIKDKVTTATGKVLCRVLWKTRRHGRLPRTWEPRDMLLEDGFEETLKMVDEWHEAGRKQDFSQCVSELYPSVAGATSAGTCMFLALQQALVLLGEPTGVQEQHIEAFLARSEELRQNMSRGVPWRVFRAFIVQLHITGSQLSMADIEYNRHRTGHRGVAAVTRLHLEDRIYLVAASNTMAVGHAFGLKVCSPRRAGHDDNVKCSLSSYGEWIDRVMFVRKVILLD